MTDFSNKRTSNDDTLVSLFKELLGESPEHATHLAKVWFEFREKSNKYWEDGKHASSCESMSRARQIQLLDKDAVRIFLENTGSGIAFLTIHMGDYLHAMLKILSMKSGKDVLIMRKKNQREDEFSMFRKLEYFDHRVTIFYNEIAQIRKVISKLRRGAILIALHDLSREWGRAITVNAFGHKLAWASGPVEIAILGKCCILPFYCFEDNDKHYCRFESPRNYQTISRSSRRHLLAAEVQLLVSQAERYIRNYPEQWSHWPLIPSMLQR